MNASRPPSPPLGGLLRLLHFYRGCEGVFSKCDFVTSVHSPTKYFSDDKHAKMHIVIWIHHAEDARGGASTTLTPWKECHVRTAHTLFFSALIASSLVFAGCQDGSPTLEVASSPDKLVPAAFDADLVPDQYIVVFKNQYKTINASKRATQDFAEGLMRDNGLRAEHIRNTYSRALNGFSATLTRDQALRLASSPAVSYIEQNQYVRKNVTWGLDRTDQDNLPLDDSYVPGGDYAGDGTGVHAYIIDTGVQDHNDFRHALGNGYDFVDDDNDATDCDGHGTHVAGTVASETYGMAPGATLHGVRVLDCQGSGTYADVIAGIDWVTANHISPAVANMSLGGGQSNSVDDAVNNSVAAGVTYAVAAGNSNANACNASPAAAADALTVGATTSTDSRASYSNYGTCLDIFAPGSSITSTWLNNGTNTISGTSMASPHVAGAAALYLGNNPGASPAQVGAALTGDATNGIVGSAGSGSPNLLLNVDGGDGGGDPFCGDNVCNNGEDCASCPGDCGDCSACGDGTCNSDEDCDSCPSDCGTCTCGVRGDSCSTNADCCSGKCRGRRGVRTCR